jgi:hypothetical protein
MFKLPPYWKLATIRCSLLCLLVGIQAFMAGVDGYDSLSQMSQLQLIKLYCGVGGAMLGTWMAFLDQTMSKYKEPLAL